MALRDIKFRGKRKDDVWVYGSLVIGTDGKFTYIFTEHGEQWSVIPETVGQYSTLKDINGRDLYEGDILDYGYVVTYVDSSDGANLGMDVGFYSQRDNFESWAMLVIGEEVEVIGNIHDK